MRISRARFFALWVAVWAASTGFLVPSNLHAWQRTIYFDRLLDTDGLPDDYINCIEQDSLGFMWFATTGGLAKYDGYEFSNYRHDPEDPGSIASNQVLSILEDSDGALWVGTDAGLDRLDRDTDLFTHYRHDPENPEGLAGHAVQTLYEDSSGRLWIGYRFSGLGYLDRESGTFVHFRHDPDDRQSLPPGAVTSVLEDQSGSIWVGTRAGDAGSDLVRFNPEQGNFDSFFLCDENRARCALPAPGAVRPPRFQVTGVTEDRDGKLWISLYEFGLVRYDPATNTYTSFVHDPEDANSLAGVHVGDGVLEDSKGRIWVADNEKGLTGYDPATGQFDRYQHNLRFTNSLGSNLLTTLFEDRDGIIWIGAMQDGLSRFDTRSLAFGLYSWVIDPDDPFRLQPLSETAWLTEDSEGLLWGGQSPEGVVRIDRKARAATRYVHDPDDPSSLQPGSFNALFGTRSGEIWIATSEGFSRYDSESDSFEHFSIDPYETVSGTVDVQIDSMAEAADRTFWLASNAAVYHFDPATGIVTRFKADFEQPGALHGASFSIQLVEDDGTVWISSHGGGLNVYDAGSGAFDHYRHRADEPGSIPQGPCCTVRVDQDGAFWAGTAHGLGRIDPVTGRFERITGLERAPTGVVNDIEFDDRGRLLVATRAEGFWIIDHRTGASWKYDEFDGLSTGSIARLTWLGGGELILEADHGNNLFRPDEIPAPRSAAPVVITDFLLKNRPVPVNRAAYRTPLEKQVNYVSDIKLTYRDYLFSFEFAALDYIRPKTVKYAYKLDGFHEDWIETDSQHRSATFTSIPAGDYEFRVKASGRDGEWGENQASIRLEILPPWWLSWWAYSVYALTFFATLFAYIRLRTLKLTRRAERLERAVEERTAQIRRHEEMIERQAADLEEQLERNENLIANITHEFRTPLTLIMGPANRLLRQVEKPQNAALLQMIRRNSRRLLRLVDQLLGLSRLKAGDPVPREAQSVNATIDAITESFGPACRERELEIRADVEPDLWVSCTPDTLDNVVLNLVSNAVKNTPPGGSVSVHARAANEGRVEIEVSDTGVGIRPEDQQAVFERFHRVAGQHERQPGSGIGMALVRELVLEHGGEIELQSEPQSGTTVRLTLPRTPPPGEQPAVAITVAERIELEVETLRQKSAKTSPVNHPDPGSDRALVLVVEDNADMRAYITALLSPEYDCLEAENGDEAVALALEYVPDLVLCDIVMPGRDGFEVSHALKEDERTSHVPIVLLTARHDRDSRLHGWKEKVDGYLTKPFDDDELLLRVANLLEVREILKSRFASRFFGDATEPNGMAPRDRDFMERLENIIGQDFSDYDFRVEQIAAGVFMSVRQLQRKLKALTGQTPSAFLRAYRLRRARELLQTGMAVSQVSDAVGFSSPAYFSTCFKAQFGITPGAYQESNGENFTRGPQASI